MRRNRLMGALLGLLLGSAALAAPVDINTADKDALAGVNGIGPVKAEAIVAYRAANGPFAAVDDLVAVKGIGTKTVEGLRDQVTVSPVAATP